MSIFSYRRVGRGNHAGLTLSRYKSLCRVTATPLNGLLPRYRMLSRLKQLVRNVFYDTVEASGIYEFACHYWGTNLSKSRKRGMTWLYTSYRKFVIRNYMRAVYVHCEAPPYDHVCYHAWHWESVPATMEEVWERVGQASEDLPGLLDYYYLLFPRVQYGNANVTAGMGWEASANLTWLHNGATDALAGRDVYSETRLVGRSFVLARMRWQRNGAYAWRWLAGFCSGVGYVARDMYVRADYPEGIPEWGAIPTAPTTQLWSGVGLYFAVAVLSKGFKELDIDQGLDVARVYIADQCAIPEFYPNVHVDMDAWFVLPDDALPVTPAPGSILDIRQNPIYLLVTPRAGAWENVREPASNPWGTGGCYFRLDYLPGGSRYCCYGVYDTQSTSWEDITKGFNGVGAYCEGYLRKEDDGPIRVYSNAGVEQKSCVWSTGQVNGLASVYWPGHALF